MGLLRSKAKPIRSRRRKSAVPAWVRQRWPSRLAVEDGPGKHEHPESADLRRRLRVSGRRELGRVPPRAVNLQLVDLQERPYASR